MVNMIVNTYNVVDAICTVDLWMGAIDPTCTMVDMVLVSIINKFNFFRKKTVASVVH